MWGARIVSIVIHRSGDRIETATSRVLLNNGDRADLTDVRIDVEDSESLSGQPGLFSGSTHSSNAVRTSDSDSGRGRSSQSVREAANRLRGGYERIQQTINQNQDAQTIFAIFNAVTPFMLLFALKMLFDNFLSIFRIVTAIGGFVAIDSRVQQLFTSARPPSNLRITSVLIFVVLFYFTSGLYIYDDGFDIKSALRLQFAGFSHHSFFFTIFVVIITDTFVKVLVVGLKILVSFSGLSMVLKRKINQLLEYMCQMYRCVIPAPQWMHYLIGVESSGIAMYANGALILFYSILKARELYGIAQKTVKSAIRMVYSTPYGVSPTREEIDKERMCSICHEDFTSPAKLCCSHIFCMPCIDTWLETENTCPICRAMVEKKDNSWKSGATSKAIRLC